MHSGRVERAAGARYDGSDNLVGVEIGNASTKVELQTLMVDQLLDRIETITSPYAVSQASRRRSPMAALQTGLRSERSTRGEGGR